MYNWRENSGRTRKKEVEKNNKKKMRAK